MSNITIYTTPAFDKKAKKLLSPQALEDLLDYLEQKPEMGQLIVGSGGIRKLRWNTGKNNKGKSGGVRVLYYYAKSYLVILVTLYSKSEKKNITTTEKQILRNLILELLQNLGDK